VDSGRVYVAGQGVTGTGTPAIAYFMTVVAYDRTTGARLWRTDKKPSDSTGAAGLWMTRAPDGSLVVTGQANRGFLDWYTVAFETTGAVRWEAVRDGGLNTDEIPRSVLVLANGTTVVTGPGGPNLPGGFIQGVTAGYSPTGTLLWEAFSPLATVWAAALPSGNVCATGGYDALITCWQTPGTVNYQPVLTATPMTGNAPLTVNFNRSVTSNPNGPIISYATLNYGDGTGPVDFGDGTSTFALNINSSRTYMLPGTYTATFTVVYNNNTSASAAVTITVNPSVIPEQLPLITATPSSGTAPLTVTLTSTATMNPNGPLISSYQVAYGDGTSNQFILNAGDGATTFTGNSIHIYTIAGAYNATLTVSYVNGVTASNSVTILVNPAVVPTPTPVPSTSTGFLSPSANAALTSNAGDNNGYQASPANAYANDSSFAVDTNSGTNTNTSCTNSGKDKHRFSSYNLNLPATAVIQGIQVRLDARADATGGSPKICVQLSWDGGATWTAAKSTTTLSTTEATYTLGSPSDTWGRSWIANDFSNTNLTVRIIDVASNTSRDFYLDYIAVNITYQP
jgi:PKD repeat protein